MFPLRIDLQEGFDNVTVTVRVNGREVYNKSGVRTKLQIGLADSFEIEIAEDMARVEVRVENTGQSAETDVRVSTYPYLAISMIRNRQLMFLPSKELFRYM